MQDGIKVAPDQLSTALKTADEHARSDFEKLATLVKEQAMETNNAITNIETKLGTLESRLQVASESAKKRQIVTIVVAILTFLAALFFLSKALIPSFGG